MGINVEALTSIINKHEMYTDTISQQIRNLESVIYDIDKCYSGDALKFLSINPIDKISDFDCAINAFEGYAAVLSNVKKAYELQDEAIASNINRTVSRLNNN